MLRQRLITALVLGALAVWGVLALPFAGFAAVVLVLVLAAGSEWARVLGAEGARAQAGFLAPLGLALALVWAGFESRVLVWALVAGAAAFWCLALGWLAAYAREPARHDARWAWRLAGWVALGGCWLALCVLARAYGPGHVLFLLALVWAADSGAYFAGRRWGRVKLAPSISPGKTREGAYGAFAATLLVALIGLAPLGVGAAQAAPFLLVCAVAVAFSIVGDLFESMLKRQHAVKDSGRLLPGHGGLLDRVDSLTAAAPVFALGLRLIGG